MTPYDTDASPLVFLPGLSKKFLSLSRALICVHLEESLDIICFPEHLIYLVVLM
jgi:hypothetical protein